MPYSPGDVIAIGFLALLAGLIISTPIAVLIKLQDMTREVGELREAVLMLCDAISGEDDGDDPDGGEEPEEESSNVVAIGKRAA